MSEPLDLTQFLGPLRAETETSWLAQAYLTPRMFNQMTGPYSILVMGEDGSGKTALELQLKAYAAQKEPPRLLAASWRPELPDDTSSNQASELFLSQAMDALSFAFLQMVSREPSFYTNAPAWARDFMHWFVHSFLRGDREYHLSRLVEGATVEGLETVTGLLSKKPRPLFQSSTLPSSILSHLTEVVKALRLEGVWIFLDGLDVIFRISPDRLERFLANFLSTLDFFEETIFAFKVIVSSQLGMRLQKSRGITTRRFNTYYLKWVEDELIHLTEKRIAFATQREDLSLACLCMDEAWLEWLRKYASDSPRGWLELTRPLLLAYLEKGKPLTKTEWLDVYRQSPPLLYLDFETARVFIGWGETPVAGIGYKLLCYLYENRHRPCTKTELYQRVYKEVYQTDVTTAKKNEERSTRSDWEGMIDTALWRLRQAVEWDKREDAKPVYIISERGKSQIHLENTA